MITFRGMEKLSPDSEAGDGSDWSPVMNGAGGGARDARGWVYFPSSARRRRRP